MAKTLHDAALQAITALPAAAANNNSASIDLRQPTADTITDAFEVQVIVPSLPNLAEDKDLTITFQDSADNNTFAAIPQLATLVITGGAGGGAVGVTHRVRLPNTARRYIRINQAVEAAGGTNTAVSTTLRLTF